MKIAAIDPGSFQSALVVLDGDDILEEVITPNQILLNRFRAEDIKADIFIFEQIECYGMPVGKDVFDTVKWTGRFIEAVDVIESNWLEMPRREVKMWLCNSMKATDANIRRTLLDRFGDWEYGKTGKGTKAHPGKLYNFHDDMWAALAIAVAYKEKLKEIKK